MTIPINFLFWGFVIALCIHIVEESTVGIGFVEMLKKYYWPEYSAKRFFWFNTIVIIIFVSGIIFFEVFGSVLLIWPLSITVFLVTNGFWHCYFAIKHKRYSPGLITTPIYWILFYFLFRYYLLQGKIDILFFIISLIIGFLLHVFTFEAIKIVRKSKDLKKK